MRKTELDCSFWLNCGNSGPCIPQRRPCNPQVTEAEPGWACACLPCARGVAGWPREGPSLIYMRVPEIQACDSQGHFADSFCLTRLQAINQPGPREGHLAAIRVTLTSFAKYSQAPRCSSAAEGQLLPAQRTPPSGPVRAEARVS